RSWLRDLDRDGGETAETGDRPRFPAGKRGLSPVSADEGLGREYETILTWEAFDAWFARIEAAELTAFDTETTSLEPMQARLVGMSFSVEPGNAAYLPLAHRGADAPAQLPFDEVLARLKPWLES